MRLLNLTLRRRHHPSPFPRRPPRLHLGRRLARARASRASAASSPRTRCSRTPTPRARRTRWPSPAGAGERGRTPRTSSSRARPRLGTCARPVCAVTRVDARGRRRRRRRRRARWSSARARARARGRGRRRGRMMTMMMGRATVGRKNGGGATTGATGATDVVVDAGGWCEPRCRRSCRSMRGRDER